MDNWVLVYVTPVLTGGLPAASNQTINLAWACNYRVHDFNTTSANHYKQTHAHVYIKNKQTKKIGHYYYGIVKTKTG